jgi:hypothetical protein
VNDARRLLRAIEILLSSVRRPHGIRSVKLDATETFIVVRREDGRAFIVEVREEEGVRGHELHSVRHDLHPISGKRPEPFVDDDGVELVTETGRLTRAGAERLFGEGLDR